MMSGQGLGRLLRDQLGTPGTNGCHIKDPNLNEAAGVLFSPYLLPLVFGVPKILVDHEIEFFYTYWMYSVVK